MSHPDDHFVVRPVARVVGGRSAAVDDGWGSIEASLELDERFTPEALQGLSDFSHLDVLYLFHEIDEADVVTGVRRPRENPAWPELGIFAQRGRVRPNRLAVSTCAIVAVEQMTVRVRGLDAIDGTPVLDLKPHMRAFGPRGPVHEPWWVAEVMAGYFDQPVTPR